MFDPTEEEFEPPRHDDAIKAAISASTDKEMVIYKPHPQRGPLTDADIEHLKGEPLGVDDTCYLVEDIDLVSAMGDIWIYAVSIKEAGLSDV